MDTSFIFENTQGHRYEVVFKRLNSRCSYVGLCDDPEDEAPKITIGKNLRPKSQLNTIIHEFAHAFFWDSSERNVNKFANKVSNFLYLLGWRHEKTKTRKAKKAPKRNSKRVVQKLRK